MLILSVLLCAAVIWRMILPLKVKWYVKILLALPFMVGALKFQIFRVIGGHYFSPDLPDLIIIGGAWLYGGFYFIPPLLGISEALRFFKWRKEQKIWNFVNLAVVCTALTLSGTALVLGAAEPVVTPLTVTHSQIPAAADGMKIVFLTDLHIDHTTKVEKIRALVRRVNGLKPELIALGGDLMDGKVAQCGAVVKELSAFEAPMGVWGVPGNHEFYSGAEEWFEFFRKNSLRMLINEAVELPNGVVVAGVGDLAAKAFFRKNSALALKYGERPELALRGIKKEKFVVLLAHRPKAALQAAALGADLQLSGHTHGGMIRGFDLLVGLYHNGWVSGRYQVGDLTLLVSNGTWLWRGFPLRLGRPGEILFVTLKLKQN